jgi:serine protease AprX
LPETPHLPDPLIEELVFGNPRYRRFTQDSPVMPDVWTAYGRWPAGWHDLLLTPHYELGAAALLQALGERLADAANPDGPRELLRNESTVVAKLSFEQLVQAVLPLSRWWQERVAPFLERLDLAGAPGALPLPGDLFTPGSEHRKEGTYPDAVWLERLVAAILDAREREVDRTFLVADLVSPTHSRARELLTSAPGATGTPLWRVSLNRLSTTAISRSRLAIKADAVARLFDVDASSIRWAVVDSGIDATHPAFRKRRDGALVELQDGRPADRTRIRATYDFRRLRAHLMAPVGAAVPLGLDAEIVEGLEGFRRGLLRGQAIDWRALEPLLRVSHGAGYAVPTNEHGTHVAGILTADWRVGDDGRPSGADLVGMAPGLELYDLRVFGEDGTTDEFTILSALQFVRHLNARQDHVVIHGVNLSMAIPHAVTNYACGRTPVCDECERLIAAGTVVVAAAGNAGYGPIGDGDGVRLEGYRALSITDPGNAERVITVGATHRYQPHTYGISYFSSRGPTGDGRAKPDLVAPGEKIDSPIPGGASKPLDGTSMAAPHVSGAAALLMARYSELIGDPERLKRVLLSSCTDLGRVREFQGAGMLDVLRALQAV